MRQIGQGSMTAVRRALGSLADDESHRKRVRYCPPQDGAHERLAVANDRQADGVQAGHRRINNMATTQRYKSLAQGHRRCQIPRRHRGHQSAGNQRRLIASSPKIPHSSQGETTPAGKRRRFDDGSPSPLEHTEHNREDRVRAKKMTTAHGCGTRNFFSFRRVTSWDNCACPLGGDDAIDEALIIIRAK